MKLERSRQGLADHLRSFDHPGGVIVSEERKFIYMKPAKTAGTSIFRKVLQPRMPGIFHLKEHPQQFNNWLGRITDDELEDYFIFSVVRNPWDRFVSIAAYFDIPFEDLLFNTDRHWKKENVRIHSLPLSDYSHVEGVNYADFICRFECLQADMNIVFDHLGMERVALPKVNKSKHRHYAACYDPIKIDRIIELYREDIKLFGYMFEQESSDPAS